MHHPGLCHTLTVSVQLQHLSATLVFYAPPHGLSAILSDLVEVFGPHRQAVVARELTKMHEEFFRCTGTGRVSQIQAETGLAVQPAGCQDPLIEIVSGAERQTG
jgi:16S rRNA (cytidine1402-2'-O)-methyltransferase